MVKVVAGDGKSGDRLAGTFFRKWRSSGKPQEARARRTFKRKVNKRKQKDIAIRGAKRRAEYEFGVKTGKIDPNPYNNRRRRRS